MSTTESEEYSMVALSVRSGHILVSCEHHCVEEQDIPWIEMNVVSIVNSGGGSAAQRCREKWKFRSVLITHRQLKQRQRCRPGTRARPVLGCAREIGAMYAFGKDSSVTWRRVSVCCCSMQGGVGSTKGPEGEVWRPGQCEWQVELYTGL